jgi:hypothetical protein
MAHATNAVTLQCLTRSTPDFLAKRGVFVRTFTFH